MQFPGFMDALPALQAAGGYEVLRTADGRSKDLICIPTPSTGMSVFPEERLGGGKRLFTSITEGKVAKVCQTNKCSRKT